MPNFEVFTKRRTPMVGQLFVTLQKRGTISLNRAAYLALGEPGAVELLFDPAARIMGLRGTDPSAEHAYPLRSQAGKDAGPFMVSGTAFVKYYGIDTSVSCRWVGVIEGGVLLVDLSRPGTPVTSNRTLGTKAESAG